MRRVLRGCGAAMLVTVGVVIPLSLGIATTATATVPTGLVSGLLEWCIPPVPTTTVPGSSGVTTSTAAPLRDYRVLLIPPPSFVELSEGGVVVVRHLLAFVLSPDDSNSVLPYDGQVLMTARFDLRAAPGHYLLRTVDLHRRVLVVSGRTTSLRVVLSACKPSVNPAQHK